MPKKPPKPKHRKRPSREAQQAHLGDVLSALVELAEVSAELHVVSSRAACVISDLLDGLNAIEEAKPRLLRAK